MNAQDSSWATPAIARVRSQLSASFADTKDGIRLRDPQLGDDASNCSTAQAVGLFVMLEEDATTASLVAQIAGSQLDDGAFTIPYNRPTTAPSKWDLAEIGAAAPGLLLAARNGHELAAKILLKSADFTLGQELDEGGRFLKNADCDGQDILNGNIYAATTLACALELSPHVEYQRAVESAVAHSISRFGAHSRDWWSYSEGSDGRELVGRSLAYQATMVGYGRLLLPVLKGALHGQWRETLHRAQEAFESVLGTPSREQYEHPSWSRDWDHVSEILLGLAPLSEEHHPTPAFVQRFNALLTGAQEIRPASAADRTPVTTRLRLACNVASVLTILSTDLEIDPTAGIHLGAAWTATVTPQEYVQRFSDVASRPAPGRWSMASGPEGSISVLLPNRMEVRLPSTCSEWLRDDYEQQQSALLWLHSLGFLPTMFEQNDGKERVEEVLRSYVEFLDSAESRGFLLRMTSLDHAVAVRIRALCAVLARYTARDLPVPDELLWLLARDASWGAVAHNIKINNHGMMLATSVLHYEALFRTEHTASRTEVVGNALRQIIEASFDSVGVCRENTPSYQAFYLRFFGDLKAFLRWISPDSPIIDLLDDIVTRGEATLSIMVWPEGILPPIGDSGAEKSSVASVDGTVFSAESGFFVQKRDNTYVSLRCGHSSIVHKHADDTSLTLRVAGVELLLDGGMYNYDWKNPATVAVKSQRGHSGVFFERFDDLYPATLFRPGHTRVRSHMTMLETAPGAISIHCGYEIDASHFAQRLATFRQGRIALSDRFWSTTGETPVQRFLVPVDAETTTDESGILLTKEGAWMRIRFDQNRPTRRYSGESVPLMRGWVSRSWGTLDACQVFEIGPLTGALSMDAELTYGTVGSEHELATNHGA